MSVVVIIIVSILFGVLLYYLAGRKGYNKQFWFIMGFFFGPFALIIIKGSLLMGYKWDKPKTFISRKETANELLLRNRPSFKTIDPMRN